MTSQVQTEAPTGAASHRIRIAPPCNDEVLRASTRSALEAKAAEFNGLVEAAAENGIEVHFGHHYLGPIEKIGAITVGP